uniref:Uncharacterized protein n=1 Tax=Magallana gigas TaxID=29159 RepID=A0A8W8JJ42_MAGGI
MTGTISTIMWTSIERGFKNHLMAKHADLLKKRFFQQKAAPVNTGRKVMVDPRKNDVIQLSEFAAKRQNANPFARFLNNDDFLKFLMLGLSRPSNDKSGGTECPRPAKRVTATDNSQETDNTSQETDNSSAYNVHVDDKSNEQSSSSHNMDDNTSSEKDEEITDSSKSNDSSSYETDDGNDDDNESG